MMRYCIVNMIALYLFAFNLLNFYTSANGDRRTHSRQKRGNSAELGSFASYAGRYNGPWAGFTVGWLYWASWVFIVGLEAALIGGILHNWFPVIPVWVGGVGITLLMTVVNIYSVKSFGEFEYWLSFIKVTIIIVFLLVGLLMIVELWPNYEPRSLEILTSYDGFAPNGIVPV